MLKLSISPSPLFKKHATSISFLKGKQEQIVKILLNNLPIASPPNLERVKLDTHALMTATLHRDKSLRRVLWMKSRVSVMSSAFEAISKAAPQYSYEIEFSDAWLGCLMLLLQAGDVDNGTPSSELRHLQS